MALSAPEKQRIEDEVRARLTRDGKVNLTHVAADLSRELGRSILRKTVRRALKRVQAQVQEQLAAEEQKTPAEAITGELTEQAKLARNTRNAANALYGVVAAAFPAVSRLARQIVEDEKAGHFSGKPMAAVSVVKQFITATARIGGLAVDAQMLESRLTGPIDPLAAQGDDDEPMTLAEAKRVAIANLNAIETAEKLGLFHHAQVDGPATDPTLGTDQDLLDAKLPQVYDGGLPWKTDADQAQCPPAPAAAAAPVAPRHLAPVAASGFMVAPDRSAAGGGVPECPPNPAPPDDREPEPSSTMRDAAKARAEWGTLRVRR